MTIGVYFILHKTSDTFYVGSSSNIEKRFSQHLRKLRANNHHCKHLQNAWNKYGESFFEFVIKQETNSIDECRKLEQVILDESFDKTYNSKNAALGGGTGDSNPMRDPLIAEKVSRARKGMKFSDEHRANMSKALKGRIGPRLGTFQTDEAKEKMRLAKLGKPSPRKGIKVGAESRLKMSRSKLGVKRGHYKSLTCPHCDKTGAGGAMARWHFDACKSKD